MGFQPKIHWSKYLDKPFDAVLDPSSSDLVSSFGKNKEVIVIVGGPACGKSSLTSRLIEESADANSGAGYVRVNQDTLKTVPKCVKVAQEALKEGKSPIIDNTNRDAKTRKNYINIAKSFKVPCRCVWIDVAKEESFHLNAFRGAVGNVYGEKRTLPDMVIHAYYKNLEEPTKNEGFSEVTKLSFTPGPFESEEHKKSFYRFTI